MPETDGLEAARLIGRVEGPPGRSSIPRPSAAEQPPPDFPPAAPAGAEVEVHIDPEIAALIPAFLAEMRSHSGRIRLAIEQGDFPTARAIAHQMAGAGGSYGFAEVTNLGRAMEQAALAPDQAELVRLSALFDEYLQNVKIVYG